jgi:hypothetical protein
VGSSVGAAVGASVEVGGAPVAEATAVAVFVLAVAWDTPVATGAGGAAGLALHAPSENSRRDRTAQRPGKFILPTVTLPAKPNLKAPNLQAFRFRLR